MEIAAPNPNPKKRKMGANRASPAAVIDGDENDDVSLLYPIPTSQNAGNCPNDAISVEQYDDDRDLQLAIMASLAPQTRRKRRLIDLDDVVSPPSSSTSRNPSKGPAIREPGRFSNSKPDPTPFTCEICFDVKPQIESFKITGCSHSYCSECMIKYVASKLQENVTKIRCPASGCEGVLEPEHCRTILPSEVFNRWGSALCEAVILAAEKFYCPFKDCSALMIDDGGEREAITQSECPNCRRLFCARCKVPWHSEIGCEEFQKLNKDEREREDIMLMQLAKKNRWMRCPKCKFYVERKEGCL
ncbi:E3 ubiquitin-protein like [Actinidia chinensis var. chinensis]|uniref:RBR-type E3 ubiquitin transferase n=1 Tax=Actinidia chinensis var. chinensis TaxID=1590841 RepID=A0A2R6PCX4_ACTCC|nr:E3 ubiquitin-protein like [Actinidia chinensis var. chinensis]